jgi:hypothetical protein
MPGKKKSKKKPAKKTSRRKKPARRAAARTRKTSKARGTSKRRRTPPPALPTSRQASSSGSDSQGLSDLETVDSESVSELIDEGNAFEAGVVSGVERADDSDGKEVRTREFPEDDVPEEYLDKD